MEELCANLRHSMSPRPSERERAEKALLELQCSPQFTPLVFQLLQQGAEAQLLLSAGILFKNYVKMSWYDEDNANQPRHRIPEETRNVVKQNIVALMLTQKQSNVKSQLQEALGIIASADFPSQWPELLNQLASHLGQTDLTVLKSVLATFELLFGRYRTESKSEELWGEIKLALTTLSQPLLATFQRLFQFKEQPEGLACLNLVVQTFHSLSAQDIPEEFENSLSTWFGGMLALLAIAPSSDEVRALQASVCELVRLYSDKYEEEYKSFCQPFVDAIWKLLHHVTEADEFDALAIAAVGYLTSVVKKIWNKDMFASPDTLKELCTRVVLPNIRLRESDVELFQFSGLEYVRRDLEGSDLYTRRRVATEFVRGLMSHFREQVSSLLFGFVREMLHEFTSNPEANWWQKDTAMYVILALAIEAETASQGVTRVNPFVDIEQFFKEHVYTELSTTQGNHILKAAALKYIAKFRAQIKSNLREIIPVLAQFLTVDTFVVHTYAAIAIQKLLSGTQHPHVDIQNLAVSLIDALKLEDSSENSYIMHALCTLCVVSGEQTAPFAGDLLTHLCTILMRIAENPVNPMFNHYVFETVIVLSKHASNAEELLFPPLQTMLSTEAAFIEFGPYVFQVLAELLSRHQSIPKHYLNMFPTFLSPAYWEHPGNVLGLVKLLQVYLQTPGFSAGQTQEAIQQLLGVFQKLISSMAHDTHGLKLLCSIVCFVDWSVISPFMPEVLKILLSRAQHSMTRKFGQGLAHFFSFYCAQRGAQSFHDVCEQVQPGLMTMVVEKLWIPHVTFTKVLNDRRTLCLGLIEFGCAYPHVCGAKVHEMIVSVLEESIKEDMAADHETALHQMQAGGFSNVFNRLVHAGAVADPVPRSGDVGKSMKELQAYYGKRLHDMKSRDTTAFQTIGSQLPERHGQVLLGYMG